MKYLYLLLFLPITLFSQGIYINEFSNGASGSKEYVELVVDGNGSCAVDIRGWIVDDNNGEFGSGSGKGIAQGHIRFKNIMQWSNVKSGSIILIYNNLDKNASITAADDETDSNLDMVYVLPANSTSLEGNATLPTTTNSAYSPVTYLVGNWNSIGLANTADGAQTRKPDGTYFHGFSYGTGLTGGTDNLWFSTAGTGKVFIFDSENYRDTSKIQVLSVAGNETPGMSNNSLNQDFINGLICPLSNLILDFKAKYENGNIISWKTSETLYIELQFSTDSKIFHVIYSGYDDTYIHKSSEAHSYYRLKYNTSYSNIIYLTHFESTGETWRKIDLLGREEGNYLIKDGKIFHILK